MMGGGEGEKEKVTVALRNAIHVMNANKTFSELAGALTKLADIADNNSAAVAAPAVAPAAVAETENDVHHTVNAAASTDYSTVNAAAPSTDSSTVNAPAVAAPAAAAPAPAVENDDNSEINDSEVISYNDGKTSSSYGTIISMLENTLEQEDISDDDKDKIRNLMIQAMQSKKPTEVQTLMNGFGTLDPVEGPPAYYKITDIKEGGTRKRRNKRNKLQRKRVKTMKNKKKKKAGKRK
jgi:hypothetical protein